MAISGLTPTTISDPKNPSAILSSGKTNTTTPPAVTASGNSLNKLANDFDTFLTLLTTQLQNQDPLQPMDSKEFTSQLVQFTSVEQSIQSNKHLEKLISLTGNNASSTAFNYIGREVKTASSSTNLANGIANWTYELDPKAAGSSITVMNSRGNAVFTVDGASTGGLHNFSWDGKDKNGNSLPDGVYSLSVSAVSTDKKPVTAKVFTTGIVTNVEISGDEPALFIGGVKVPLKDVMSVMQGGGSSAALNYLGREIRSVNPSTNLTNGKASWTYELDPNAVRNIVTIKDSSGKIVLKDEGKVVEKGLQILTWTGLDQDGNQLPDGVYSASVVGLDANDATVNSKLFTNGTVTGVDTSGSEPVLVVGNVKISLRDVLTVTETPANTNVADNQTE